VPASAIGAAPPAPAVAPSAVATQESPFINTLGMRFVPVPITGGPTNGRRVLFSVWDTRVQDYEAYAAEKPSVNMEWKDAEFRGKQQGPVHPVVMVNWEDTQGFCRWLTERERKAGKLGVNESYRLPSDHEWSCAVEIGDREDANAAPYQKNRKIKDVYPGDGVWSPSPGAGNFGRSQGNTFTTPVGSFSANRFGLYDMGGNVGQWCEDSYSGSSDQPVVRGFSPAYFYDRSYLLSSLRSSHTAGGRDYGTGFRCVVVSTTRDTP